MFEKTYEKEANKELKKFKKQAMHAAFAEGFNQPFMATFAYHPLKSIGAALGVDVAVGTALEVVEEAAKFVIPTPVRVAVGIATVGAEIVAVKTMNGIAMANQVGKSFDNLTYRQRT